MQQKATAWAWHTPPTCTNNYIVCPAEGILWSIFMQLTVSAASVFVLSLHRHWCNCSLFILYLCEVFIIRTVYIGIRLATNIYVMVIMDDLYHLSNLKPLDHNIKAIKACINLTASWLHNKWRMRLPSTVASVCHAAVMCVCVFTRSCCSWSDRGGRGHSWTAEAAPQ